MQCRLVGAVMGTVHGERATVQRRVGWMDRRGEVDAACSDGGRMVGGENGGARGVEERKDARRWKGRGRDPRARKRKIKREPGGWKGTRSQGIRKIKNLIRIGRLHGWGAHQTERVREGDGGVIWQFARAVDKTRQQGETAMRTAGWTIMEREKGEGEYKYCS
jgi:hypothetical protein